MPTLQPIRYPLDSTGASANNWVQGEIHALPARTVRVLAPTYGAFFTTSMVVTDLANNQVLTRNTQWYAAELYEVPSAKYGAEICAIVVITDTSVSPNVSVSYQALGGEYSTSADAVINQINTLLDDNRPVAWGDIINKPEEYPPSHHLHDIGDVYGFEYLVHAIDRLRAAVELGDDFNHDTIYQYIDDKYASIQAGITANTNAINAHVSDRNNPHQTTAAQVGAYTTAQTDAAVGAVNTTLQNHLADHSNPHAVTAAQLGVYTTGQTYTQSEVNAAISAAITNLQNNLQGQINTLNGNLAAHTSNFNNPHGDTAAQVGTYTTATIDAKIAAGQQPAASQQVTVTGGHFGSSSPWTWTAPGGTKGMIEASVVPWAGQDQGHMFISKNGLLVVSNGTETEGSVGFRAGDQITISSDAAESNFVANIYFM